MKDKSNVIKSWNIISFHSTYMEIKVTFFDPLEISDTVIIAPIN